MGTPTCTTSCSGGSIGAVAPDARQTSCHGALENLPLAPRRQTAKRRAFTWFALLLHASRRASTAGDSVPASGCAASSLGAGSGACASVLLRGRLLIICGYWPLPPSSALEPLIRLLRCGDALYGALLLFAVLRLLLSQLGTRSPPGGSPGLPWRGPRLPVPFAARPLAAGVCRLRGAIVTACG